MRYSLLNFVVCPRCHGDLTTVVLGETPFAVADTGQARSDRVPPEGALVGPVPTWKTPTPLANALQGLAAQPAAATRGFEVVLEEGLLVCGTCGAWFPVRKWIPELLSDHLRDWSRDRAWLETHAGRLPEALLGPIRAFAPAAATDAGAHHKLAEITLPSKIQDPHFFGPGYVSPFNIWTPEHTWHLIRNFAVTEPLLEARRNEAVLDAGAGYAWTTEWMLRGGYEPIGLDIVREYFDIAITRVGANRPHLVVGDTEHLPIRDDSIQAVLAFEAFHHIPDRPAAMREFARVLQSGKPVVLVEPGAAHEHDKFSREIMEKWGTLEKGMELVDVAGYVAGSDLGDPQQHQVIRSAHAPGGKVVDTHPIPIVANHVFTVRKRQGMGASMARHTTRSWQRFTGSMARRTKRWWKRFTG